MQALRFGLFLGASYYVFVYLRIAFLRLNYPYDVEWMESGPLEHVARVLHGQPLYVSPTIVCGAAFACVVLVSTALLGLISHGWYRYYVFELPRAHGIDLPDKLAFWRSDLLPSVPFILAARLLCLTQTAGARVQEHPQRAA